MKRSILFSLCAITPFLLYPDAFEPIMFEDEKIIEPFEEESTTPSRALNGSINKNGTNLEVTYQNTPEDKVSSTAHQTSSQRPAFQLPIDHSGNFVNLEFLYWKLDETGLDYAVHKKQGELAYQNLNPGADQRPQDGLLGEVHQIDFEWSPGFRVGFGHRFENLWELSGVYTFYYTDGSDHVNVKNSNFQFIDAAIHDPAGEAITPAGINAFIGVLIGAKARGQFWYHIGDIELATEFSLPRMISLRFCVGPSIAFIQQKFHATYFDNDSPSFSPSQFSFYTFDWKFKGAGVKLGMDSHWNFYKEFNLLFGGAFSSIYGSYTNIFKSHIRGNPDLPTTTFSGPLNNATFKNGRVIYGTRLLGGIEWNKAFAKWNLDLFAKYELNTWFNLTDQYRTDISTQDTSGFEQAILRQLQTPPLNLQGITVGANINF